MFVHFSRSVVSDCLWPHGLQDARLPCPSPTPGACSDSCPLSRWCHLTISYSVIPFSSCLQSFPASGSFPASQFFLSGGQSIGVSACASVLPVNIQDLFPLGWTGLIVCIGHSCLLLWSLFKSFTHFLLVCLLVIHSSFHAMDVRVGLWRKLSTDELMLLNCGVGEDSWEFPGLQGDPTSPS